MSFSISPRWLWYVLYGALTGLFTWLVWFGDQPLWLQLVAGLALFGYAVITEPWERGDECDCSRCMGVVPEDDETCTGW